MKRLTVLYAFDKSIWYTHFSDVLVSALTSVLKTRCDTYSKLMPFLNQNLVFRFEFAEYESDLYICFSITKHIRANYTKITNNTLMINVKTISY
jgi:hypothetical protein